MADLVNPLSFSDHAIQVHPDDNVAVIKFGIDEGTQLSMPKGDPLVIRGKPTAGHRFALVKVAAGDSLIQYGQPIGKSRESPPGRW